MKTYMTEAEARKKYRATVKKCKELIAKKTGIELQIGQYAIEVCDIVVGGDSAHVYNMRKFADDLGVNHDTMKAWVTGARVYNVLPPELQKEAETRPLSWLRRASTKSGGIMQKGMNPKRVEAAYKQIKTLQTDKRRAGVNHLQTQLRAFVTLTASGLGTVPQRELVELETLLVKSLKLVRKYKRKQA